MNPQSLPSPVRHLAALLFSLLFISVTPAAELRGRVTDAVTGKSLNGAVVTLSPGSGPALTATADVFGRYTILGIPAGGYLLQASHPGYVTSTDIESYSAAELAVKDLPLTPLVPGVELIDVFVQALDTSTMRQLAGVPVRVQRFDSSPNGAAAETVTLTTNSEGWAVLRSRPKSWFTFRFNDAADGPVKAQYAALDRPTRVRLDSHHTAVAQLLPTKRNVKITVTGPDPARPDDGMVPLKNVYVEVLGVSFDPPTIPPGFDPLTGDARLYAKHLYPPIESRTDANGEVEMKGLPPLIYVVTTKKPGYRTPQIAIVPDANELLPATFAVTLMPDLRTKVDVMLTSPYPSPKLAPVAALRLEGIAGTATAGIERMKDGGMTVAPSPTWPLGAMKFTFSGTDHLVPGRYRVCVTDKTVASAEELPAFEGGFSTVVEMRFRGDTTFDLGVGEETTVELAVKPIPATIRGRLFRAAERASIAVPPGGAPAPEDRWEGMAYQPFKPMPSGPGLPEPVLQFVESVLADLLPPGVDLVSADVGMDGSFSLSVLPGIYGVAIPGNFDWGSNYRAVWTNGDPPPPPVALGWPYATAAPVIPMHPFGSKGIPLNSGDDIDIDLYIRNQLYYLNGNVIVDLESVALDRMVARDGTLGFSVPHSHVAATLEAVFDENGPADLPGEVSYPLVPGESVDAMGTKTPSSGGGFVIPVGPGTHAIWLRHKAGFADDHFTLPLGDGGPFTLPDYGFVGSGATPPSAVPGPIIPLENCWERLPAGVLPDPFLPDYTNEHTLSMRFFGKTAGGDPIVRFTRSAPHFAQHPDFPHILIPIRGTGPFKMMKGDWKVWRHEEGHWYEGEVDIVAGDPTVKVVDFNLVAEYPIGPGPLGEPSSPDYDLKLRAINEADPMQEVANIKVNFGDDPTESGISPLHLHTSASAGTSLETTWKGGYLPLSILSDGSASAAGITQWMPAFGTITPPLAYHVDFAFLSGRPTVTVTMRLKRGSSVKGIILAGATDSPPASITKPLAGARVKLLNRFGRLLQSLTTDELGAFVTSPALTNQEILFVELDAAGYLPTRFRVTPASTGVLTGTTMDFDLGSQVIERLPQPAFAGTTPVFDRKGMFLVGVSRGTVAGGSAFGEDPDVKMTCTPEAAPPAPPAHTYFQTYDRPDGTPTPLPPMPVDLPDQVVAFWIVGQRTWKDNPTETSGTLIRPPFDVFPIPMPPGDPDAAHAGKVNPLFPVQMKTWLADLQKVPSPGVRKEIFVRRIGAMSTGGGTFSGITTIDLATLPPGLFQPYIIAETRLGAYKVIQIAYSGTQASLNLYGMQLPSYLDYMLDAIGTISRAQTIGSTKLEAAYNIGGFCSFTPKIAGDITVTAAGPSTGTLDYQYELGANFGVGERMSSGGLLTFLPDFIGLEVEGLVDFKVAGSNPTLTEPGNPSVTLTGKGFGGLSVNVTDLLPVPPIVKEIKKPIEFTVQTKIGGGVTSSELGQLPSAGNEHYRPLARSLKFTIEGGVQSEIEASLLRTALFAVPVVGPPLSGVLGLAGADINSTLTSGFGAMHSRARTTRYRVPGELLPSPVPPPGSGDDTVQASTYPIGRTEPAANVLTRLVSPLGDEVLSESSATSTGLYAGYEAGITASLAGQEAKITIGTAGPDEAIIGLPSLLFSLNTNSDGPNTVRVQGAIKCTGELTANLLFATYKAEHEFGSIPVDISFNTVPVFHLVPFEVTESVTLLTAASSVLWCGAEPHLAANYSLLSPHAAAASGAAQTMAYIDPDSGSGTMSLKVARQLSQGVWSAPVTVATAPGIVSMAVAASPGAGSPFIVAWSEVSAPGLTALVPVTTIKYSTSTTGLTWTAATTIGVTTGGTAINLKWLAMSGSTLGLVWEKNERGPGATTLDIQGAFFSGGAFGPIITLYDEADLASWDAVGPGFPEPTTAKIVRLSNTGALTVADWSGTTLGAPTTLGTVGTAVNCRITAAPMGIFLVAAADTAGAFKFYKKTGPGAWGTLTTPAGLSTAAPRELALCTAVFPPGPRFFLTWTEGADHRHPVFAYMDPFGVLLHGPTHIASDTPGNYSKLIAMPIGSAHAADIHAFFKNGDTGELRAFPTTLAGLPAADRDADTLNDYAELRLVDASSTDALTRIDHITAPADFDGDGYSNGAEFTAGTDAADADSFPAQRLQIEVTVPDAYELSNDAGAVTITRTGHTAVAVTARYTVTGTAANGTDCVLLSGTEIIPAGVSAATIPIEPLSDALAEGSELAIITLAADAAYTIGAMTSASVTIHDLPFDAWRFSKFTAAELANNALGGTLGDAESDALTNLLEYAFDMEPKNGALTDLPVSGIVTHPGTLEKHLALSYLRRKNDLELVYVVQLGSDLTGWTDATDADVEEISIVDNADGTETITVRDKTPLTAQPRRFLRVDVRRVD